MATIGDGGMGRAALRAQWSDLPDELLEMVRSKVACPRGRIRLAAVCRSWRAAASRHPLSALPLLLLSPCDWGSVDKHKLLYCPEDAGVLQVRLPACLRGTWFNGSYDGGWIAAGRLRARVVVANLFSGVQVPLSEKQRTIACPHHRGLPYHVWKTVFSEAPTSGRCILAAITDVCNCNLALCRIGCPDSGWTLERCDKEKLSDIVFCRGVLYGMARSSENVFRYDIGEKEDGAPMITAAHPLNVQMRHGPRSMGRGSHGYASYIFDLHGKLAMAVMIKWSENWQPFFKVFELAEADEDSDEHDYKWVEVHSLGDYALFLGLASSSRAVHAPTGGCGGVNRNHIYYSKHRCLSINTDKKFDGKAYLTRSTGGDPMYCKEDEDTVDDMEKIPSLGYHVVGGPYPPVWCLPPDF